VERYKIVGMPEQTLEVLRDLEVHGVYVNCIVVAKAFEKLAPQTQDALLQIGKVTTIRLNFLIDQMGFAQRSSGRAKEEHSSVDPTESPSANCLFAEDLLAFTRRPYWRVKRALDFVAAFILLIVLAPLILFAAILVVIDVGLPVTFWQQRPGLEGRSLKLHKFRTMAAAHDACGRRVSDEERTSNIGRFLRRTRFDEFPQLLNILSGEMSFVGPRPLLPADQPANFAARLLVRPGLTGWAQVKGGRAISATDKGALDIWYVRHASLALDLEILARTVPMVLFGESIDAAAIQTASRELQEAGLCTSSEFAPKAVRPASIYAYDWAKTVGHRSEAVSGSINRERPFAPIHLSGTGSMDVNTASPA
jgi:lipopolysaccharide/colanic/teichoic acid biosynthesis glycosyltransferase